MTWDIPPYKGHTSSIVLAVYFQPQLKQLRHDSKRVRLKWTKLLCSTQTLALIFESSLARGTLMHLAGGAKVAATACATASISFVGTWVHSAQLAQQFVAAHVEVAARRQMKSVISCTWTEPLQRMACEGLGTIFFYHGPNWISAGLLITQPLQPKLWNLMESKWLTKYQPVDTYYTVHSLRSLRCIISFKESPPGIAGELEPCQSGMPGIADFPSPWCSMLLFTFMKTLRRWSKTDVATDNLLVFQQSVNAATSGYNASSVWHDGCKMASGEIRPGVESLAAPQNMQKSRSLLKQW